MTISNELGTGLPEMQMIWSVVFPWLTGGIILYSMTGPVHRTGYKWFLAGAGYFVGVLLLTISIRTLDALGFGLGVPGPMLMLSTLAVLAGGIGYYRGGKAGGSEINQEPRVPVLVPGRIVCGVVLFAVVFHLLLYSVDIWLRPLFPWDAWTTWAVRAKAWLAAGSLVPFVDHPAWVAAEGEAGGYFLEAYFYPPTVSLIQLWGALVHGGWSDRVVLMPWMGAAIALSMSLYGYFRLVGASGLQASLLLWMFVSLPVLGVSVALAGYADLWMAAFFAMAVMMFLLHQKYGAGGFWPVGLLLAAACAQIKVEGVVWSGICMLLALLAIRNVTRRRLALFAGGLAVLTLLSSLPVQEHISTIFIDPFTFTFHNIWGSVLSQMLLLGSWHLYWWLFPVAIVVAWGHGYSREKLVCLVPIVSGCLVLFVTFFLTEKYRWAASMTATSRVALHLVPAQIAALVALYYSGGCGGRRSGFPMEPSRMASR